MGELRQITAKKCDVTKEKGLRAFLGKNVLSKDGDVVGTVKDVVFEEDKIVGIIYTKKIFKKIFLGINYIEKFYADSLILKINPVTRLIGMKVYDVEGKKVGVVKDIVRKTNINKIDALIVRKGIFKKFIEVPVDDIDISKKNVILNKLY